MMITVMAEKKTPGGRRKDPTYQQVNLSLKPELVKKLKLVALENDLNLSELAETAFNKYLESLNKEA
jgi:post-segregation antitoxin (ccd killing protein)